MTFSHAVPPTVDQEELSIVLLVLEILMGGDCVEALVILVSTLSMLDNIL